MADKLPGKQFLQVIFGSSLATATDQYQTVLDVINQYMTGEPLTTVLESHHLTLHKFLYLVQQYPQLVTFYEDATLIHKAALKDKLVSSINSKSTADWKAAAWLLERMWPDEFGKHISLDSPANDSSDPPCLQNYTNADFVSIDPKGDNDA